MGEDPALVRLLRRTVREERTAHVIETGTFDGRGSTTFVAESFDPCSPPERFVTMEVNRTSWLKARTNLARFPWITCLWGRSVPYRRALAFVRHDPALRFHERYPDIFVDDPGDPIGFYTREVQGKLGGARREQPFRWLVDRAFRYGGDGLLQRWLARLRRRKPLVILDSAGGIGYLEFMTLIETMGENPFLLLMDDINHVKHFRSLAYIRSHDGFVPLGVDENRGWALVKKTRGRPRA